MKSDFDADELNLIKLAKEYSDEDKARELWESIRWPDGPVCPNCKNHKEKPIYRLAQKVASATPGRKGLLKCGACREQFTARVGTILEGSHLPISLWLQAIFILCSSKKSISSHQIHRMLGITYKTAWFLTHRIRYAMQPDMPLGKLLTGTVEVDETYVGGKPRRGPNGETKVKPKTPVVALVERGGEVRTRVVANVTQKNLGACLEECVGKEAIVNTDQAGVYIGLVKPWKEHQTVNHSEYEYSRTNADGSVSGVNHAESFFSLLKRGVYGSWHHVSKEHLPKYAGEFAFRWNQRGVTDGKRMVEAIKTTEGKRLAYKPLIRACKPPENV